MSNCPLKSGEMQWDAQVPDICKIRCVNKALLFASEANMTQPTTHDEIAKKYPDQDVERMDGGVNTGIERFAGSSIRTVIEEVGKDPDGSGDNTALELTNVTTTTIDCKYDGTPQE